MSISTSNLICSKLVLNDQRFRSSSPSFNDRINTLVGSGGAFLMEPRNPHEYLIEMAKAIRESVCLPDDWRASEEILMQDRMR